MGNREGEVKRRDEANRDHAEMWRGVRGRRVMLKVSNYLFLLASLFGKEGLVKTDVGGARAVRKMRPILWSGIENPSGTISIPVLDNTRRQKSKDTKKRENRKRSKERKIDNSPTGRGSRGKGKAHGATKKKKKKTRGPI